MDNHEIMGEITDLSDSSLATETSNDPNNQSNTKNSHVISVSLVICFLFLDHSSFPVNTKLILFLLYSFLSFVSYKKKIPDNHGYVDWQKHLSWGLREIAYQIAREEYYREAGLDALTDPLYEMIFKSIYPDSRIEESMKNTCSQLFAVLHRLKGILCQDVGGYELSKSNFFFLCVCVC